MSAKTTKSKTKKSKKKGKKPDQEAKTATEVAVEQKPAAEPTEVISPWKPWSPFADLFPDWPNVFGRRWPDIRPPMSSVETIRVEQFTEDGEIVVRAELPGVDPDSDIEVTVDNGTLTISAHRERREEHKNGGLRTEFHYGAFVRTMALPQGKTADDVRASYEDGILEIRIPQDNDERAKTRVPISRG